MMRRAARAARLHLLPGALALAFFAFANLRSPIVNEDGVLYLLASLTGGVLAGGASPGRGSTMLNGSVPHYNVYECADGGWISIGSLEPHFFANLCKTMGREDFIPHQWDSSKREEISAHFAAQFKSRPRDEWFKILSETDICAGPVYSLEEALNDPHNRARSMVVEVDHPTLGKVAQLGVGTKLSETPGAFRSFSPSPGRITSASSTRYSNSARRASVSIAPISSAI